MAAAPKTSRTLELPKGVKYDPPRKKEKLSAPEIKKLDPSTKVVYVNV